MVFLINLTTLVATIILPSLGSAHLRSPPITIPSFLLVFQTLWPHSQLLECAMHFSTSGPLHKIFLLPGTLFLLSLWPLFCFQLIPTHNSDFNPLKYFLQDADHRSLELGQVPVLTSFIRHLSTVVKRGSAVTFLWFTFWLCHLLAVWFGAKYLTILWHSSFHIILFISHHTMPLALELLWE